MLEFDWCRGKIYVHPSSSNKLHDIDTELRLFAFRLLWFEMMRFLNTLTLQPQSSIYFTAGQTNIDYISLATDFIFELHSILYVRVYNCALTLCRLYGTVLSRTGKHP